MNKSISRSLLLVAGFLTGILIGSFFIFDLIFIGLPLLIAIGLLSLDRQSYFLAIIFCLGVALGLWRVHLTPTASPVLAAQVGVIVDFEAVVVAAPDRRDTTTLVVVRPKGYRDKILISEPSYLALNYGDQIKLTGRLTWPENFTTETGKIFNYQKYLEKDGIFFTSFQPEIKITGASRPTLTGFLFAGKNRFTGGLEKIIPEPQVSLLTGLLVGERQGLGADWNDRFRAVGLSHIVVLSGYNLSVVAENLLRIGNLLLPRFSSASVGGLAIILFALLAGGGPAVTRAAIMALVALLARVTGRLYTATVALIAAGVLMIIWNPWILVFDLGFQLSFLATLGVIHGPSLLKPYFTRLPEQFGFQKILLTTLSAQIAVLPWLLHTTGNLSIVALPANLLVLPIIPLTMLGGFLAGIGGGFFPLLALPPAWFAQGLLTYILVVVKIFAALPFAALTLNLFPLSLTIAGYTFIGWWAITRKK